jgi:hypothetical protein
MRGEDNKRKSIAPEKEGEKPNELRCRVCWNLLSLYDDGMNRPRKWCFRCQIFYE